MREFAQCDVEYVEKILQTSAKTGLSCNDVERHRQEWGKNVLLPDYRISVRRFMSRLAHKISVFFMLFSLILAAFFLPLYVALAVGCAYALFLAVLFVFFAYREKEYRKLALASLPYIRVIRDGKLLRISPEELVVGDLLKLTAGDVLYVNAYIVSEAAVEAVCERNGKRDTYVKHGGPSFEEGEAHNLLLFGDALRSGECRAIVTDVSHAPVRNEWEIMSLSEKSQTRLCRMSVRLSVAFSGIGLLFAFFFVRDAAMLVGILLSIAVLLAISPASWCELLFDCIFLSRNRKMLLKSGALFSSVQVTENVAQGNCYLLPTKSVFRGSKYVVRSFESGTGVKISENSSQNTQELTLISSVLLQLREKYAVPFSEKHFMAFCKKHLMESLNLEIGALAFSNQHDGMSIAAVRNFSDGRAFSFVGADPEDLLPYVVSVSEKGRTRLLDKQSKNAMLSSVRKLKKEGYELIAYAETQTRVYGSDFPALNADMKLLGFFVLSELPDKKIELALSKIVQDKSKAFFFHNGDDPSWIMEAVPLLKDAPVIDARDSHLPEKIMEYISSSDIPFAIGIHFSPIDQSKLAHLLENAGYTTMAYGSSFADHRLMCASSIAVAPPKNANGECVGIVHSAADVYASEHISSQTVCVSEARTMLHAFDVSAAYFCVSLLARSVIFLCGILLGVFLLNPLSLAILSCALDMLAYVFLSHVVSKQDGSPDILSARNRNLGLFLGSFLGALAIGVLAIVMTVFPQRFGFGVSSFVFPALLLMLNVGVFRFSSARFSVHSFLFALFSVLAIVLFFAIDFWQSGVLFGGELPFWVLIPTVVLFTTGKIMESIFISKNKLS